MASRTAKAPRGSPSLGLPTDPRAVLHYAFAVFLLPMQRELGFSTAQLSGAFSLALLVSAVAGVAVGR